MTVTIGYEEEMIMPNEAENSEPTQGYLIDIETGEQFTFSFNPESIDDNKNVSYAVIKIAGRSNPFIQWSSSDERNIQFALKIYRLTDDNQEVTNKIKWLESLQYPEYDDEGYLISAPHRVLFIFGNRYTGDQKWVVESAKISFSNLWTKDLSPLFATVTISLIEWNEENINYSDIRG